MSKKINPVSVFWVNLFVLNLGLFIAIAGFSIPNTIQVNNQFRKKLEFVVSDTNPDRMIKYFGETAQFLKDNNFSDRDICAWFYDPLCDTSLFYSKLLDAQEILKEAKESDLNAKNNTLIRIRESFVTTASEGESLAYPNMVYSVRLWFNNPKLASIMGIVTWGLIISLMLTGCIAYVYIFDQMQ